MTSENDYKLSSQEVCRRFISSLPSEVTREYYHRWLHYFMDWLQVEREEYDRLLDYDPRILQSKIIDYVIWMKDEKKTIIIKEDELQLSINELEAKEIELQKATIELQQHLAELQEYNIYHDDLNPEVKQEDIISTNNRRWRPCG